MRVRLKPDPRSACGSGFSLTTKRRVPSTCFSRRIFARIATPRRIFSGGTVTNDRRSVLSCGSFAKNGPPGTNATFCAMA